MARKYDKGFEPPPPFVPKAGSFINVQLPNELIRSTVHKVVDQDHIIVHLNLSAPMLKTHSYKEGDLVPARRTSTVLGEVWQAVPEHEMERVRQAQAAKQREEFERKQRARA